MADVEGHHRRRADAGGGALRSGAEICRGRAAVSAVPGSECRRQLQRARARRLAPGHVPDSAAPGADDEVRRCARSCITRRCRGITSRSRSRWRTAPAALPPDSRLRRISALQRGLGPVRRAARRRSGLVRRRSGGTARSARFRAVPRAPPRRRHRPSPQALDAAAGDRLRDRGERSGALRRQPGPGLLRT